jgi:hypothetical protein
VAVSAGQGWSFCAASRQVRADIHAAAVGGCNLSTAVNSQRQRAPLNALVSYRRVPSGLKSWRRACYRCSWQEPASRGTSSFAR